VGMPLVVVAIMVYWRLGQCRVSVRLGQGLRPRGCAAASHAAKSSCRLLQASACKSRRLARLAERTSWQLAKANSGERYSQFR
jgi:hypothetical protein